MAIIIFPRASSLPILISLPVFDEIILTVIFRPKILRMKLLHSHKMNEKPDV